MEINNHDWRDFIEKEKFEESLKHILSHQGYFVTLFNAEGEVYLRKDSDKWNHLMCENCKQNKEACKEHYLLAQMAISGKDGKVYFCEKDRQRILFSAPLLTSFGMNLGAIVACKNVDATDSEGNQREINFLKSISSLLADKIYQDLEIKHLTNEISSKYEELSILYEISENTSISDESSSAIDYIISRAMEALNPSLIVWSELKFEKNRLYWNKEEDSQREIICEKIIEALCLKFRRMLQKFNEPLIFNNLGKYREFEEICELPWNVLCVPLKGDGKWFGYFSFFQSDKEKVFTNHHLMLIESISRSTTTVLRNTDLYNKLKGLFFNVIHMLLGIIENKDSYTEGHSKRVYRASILFADILKLSRRDKFDLQWAAILHDIGKITIPSSVIKKRGPLTDEEWKMMKTHPAKGAEMVSNISEFKNAAKGIETHHERIDGKGYPNRLRGKEIPLIGKIIAVADTFDALRTERPYRKKPDDEFLLSEMKNSSSTQLDPMLVGILLDNLEEFKKITNDESMEILEKADIKGIW